MTIRERLKGWRTIIWNGIVSVAGLGVILSDQFQAVPWDRVFTPQVVGWLVVALSVAGIIFRIITTSELGKKC